VRFFPKHETQWSDGPAPQLRPSKSRFTDQRAEVRRPEKLSVSLPVTVKEFSLLSGVRQAEIIKFFLKRRIVLNANSHLDEDQLETLGIGLNIDVTVKKELDLEAPLREIEERTDAEDVLQPRPPVVALLGHVDHGKTSILDQIRKSNVQEREFGGITQHISAYRIELPELTVTFIDTPGHAAFTQMRARGANATDIAVLVVAADDGPMPQTEEAISHIKAAECPIVVAINKIDVPTANVQLAKQRLTELGLIPPEWGGDTEMVEVSAVTGQGIDALLETLHLVGEVQGLTANPGRDATGLAIEARSSQGRGILVTALVQNGTLRVGDYVLCGQAHGRIRGMWSTTTGEPISEAGPSTPVEIMGLSDVPEAGERFYVLRDEQLGASIAERRLAHLREAERAQREEKVTLENLFDRIKDTDEKELRLVLKADVQGSVEAIEEQVLELGTDEVKVKVLHAGVGMISENDVVLAEASKGIVIGFNVTVAERARTVAEERGVQIRHYTVIYELLDEVRAALEDRLSPVMEEVIRGHAEIRRIFKASRIGTIAGCMVTDGTIGRNDQIRVLRDRDVIHTGDIASLRREKDDAKDVREGFECGIKVANFDDIQQGDVIECFRTVAKRRTL
jgi:translation initiation factor IF-2